MSKAKWSTLRKGDRVELSGREWRIEKLKPKGGKLRVTVSSGPHRAEAKVKPSDKVKLAASPQKAEKPLPPPARPRKATGDPWETQSDRIERKMDEILGARLIGVKGEKDAGYFVPPVDMSTIVSHALVFHGWEPDGDEAAMLRRHAEEHASGDWTGAVPHTHSEVKPGKEKT